MKVEIETINIGRIAIVINWLLVSFGLFFLFTAPFSTEFVIKYAIIFVITCFFTVLDWFIVSSALGLREDDETAESFNSITVEQSPKHWVQIFGGGVGVILLISVIIGAIWAGYYYTGVIFQGKQYIAVPDLFTSVPLTASPIPFVDTGTFMAFAEAYVVAVTEEQFFTGLIFASLWGTLLLIFSKFGIRQSGILFVVASIFIMIIAAIPAAWASVNIQHFFAYQKQQYAFDKGYDHFLYANLIDGSVGTIIPSTMAHFANNYAYKWKKYHQSFEAIPLQGIDYIPLPSG